MRRILIALAVAAVAGGAASQAALMQGFGVTFAEIVERLWARGPVFAIVVAAPLMFWLLKGWVGFWVSALLLSAGLSLVLKLYVADDAPWSEIATMGVVYGLAATAVYRLLVGRMFG